MLFRSKAVKKNIIILIAVTIFCTLIPLPIGIGQKFGINASAATINDNEKDLKDKSSDLVSAETLIKESLLVPGTTIFIKNKSYTVLDTNSYVGGEEKNGILLLYNDVDYCGYVTLYKLTLFKLCNNYKNKHLSCLKQWLLPTYKSCREYDQPNIIQTDLNGDYVFELSYQEYEKYKEYIPALKLYKSGPVKAWWFRSTDPSQKKGRYIYLYSEYEKKIILQHYESYGAIRPAFNISKNTLFRVEKDKRYVGGVKLKFDKSKFYNVKCNYMGVAKSTSMNVLQNNLIKKPADPLIEGYEFKGWYKDKTFTTAWDFDNDIVTKNLTLYAKFLKINTVTFFNMYESGNTEVYSINVLQGDKVPKPVDPQEEGYEFMGWYYGPLYNLYKYRWDFDNNIVTNNITLYSKYSKIYTQTVTFNIYENGNRELNSLNIVRGDKIPKPADPIKEGYQFEGWYYGPWYNHYMYKWDFDNNKVMDNISLYAKFIK